MQQQCSISNKELLQEEAIISGGFFEGLGFCNGLDPIDDHITIAHPHDLSVSAEHVLFERVQTSSFCSLLLSGPCVPK